MKIESSLVKPVAVVEKIARAHPQLSRLHRRVADFVLQRPLHAASMPINELAVAAGVSIATANRFARALGFAGYAAFRTELVRGSEEALMRTRFRADVAADKKSTAAAALDYVLESINRGIEVTGHGINIHAFEATIEHVLRARSIYIFGEGRISWLAGLLQHELSEHLRSVKLLNGHGGMAYAKRALLHANSKDVLIGLISPECLGETMALLELARRVRCRTLVVVDRLTSPAISLSDIAMSYSSQGDFDCDTKVLALNKAIVGAVVQQSPNKAYVDAQPLVNGSTAKTSTPTGIEGSRRADA
jgi:DNA-binding MurR/RpiR family transcriptional regulator